MAFAHLPTLIETRLANAIADETFASGVTVSASTGAQLIEFPAVIVALEKGTEEPAHSGNFQCEISLTVLSRVDPDNAELAAAGHDVARHISPEALLKYALDSGLEVNPVEQRFPILLHGPVGSAWLEREGSITDQEILHSIRWHTTGHPNLSPLGQIVFLADKLDPNKKRSYPFQETVKQAARIKLSDGMTEFLNGALQQ
ncbi:MAG: bis(5'-nucleosyl)-tetraphosphatase (symmetrical) YqeK, partial [Pedosphaera sp.]|nr:bis(5'-nucleosyl)-tetraphosphatase (symmetrical) YqeK [Pedosphaera sp.]